MNSFLSYSLDAMIILKTIYRCYMRHSGSSSNFEGLSSISDIYIKDLLNLDIIVLSFIFNNYYLIIIKLSKIFIL